MSSKATTALLRLKEIDTKYKSRNYKFIRESSSDGSDKESREILRPRLNIQMPDTYVEFLSNYSSDNEQKLPSPIEVIPSALESSSHHVSDSREVEKSVIELKEKWSEDTGEETLEESICEVLQESTDEHSHIAEVNRLSSIGVESIMSKERIINFSEFLDNYSNAAEEQNESLSHKIDTIATTEEKLSSSESSESHIERTVESYSQEPFESNVSSSEENESDGEETLASGTSDSLPPVTEIYEEEKSEIIPNHFQEQSTFQNDEIDKRDNILRETNDIIEMTISQSSNVNNQPINIELNSQQEMFVNSPTQCANTNVHGESSAQSRDRGINTENGNVKTYVIDELSESTASQLLSKSEQSIIHLDGGDITKERNEYVKDVNTRRKTGVEIHQRATTEEICENVGRTHSIQKEHKHISSSIKQYLRRLDEENSHHRIFPNRLSCPETSYLRVIRPLQFPKIPEFFLSGDRQNHDPDIVFLRSRLIDIRQWLKDQYTIYKDHCDLAKSINKNYQHSDPTCTKTGTQKRQR